MGACSGSWGHPLQRSSSNRPYFAACMPPPAITDVGTCFHFLVWLVEVFVPLTAAPAAQFGKGIAAGS